MEVVAVKNADEGELSLCDADRFVWGILYVTPIFDEDLFQ